jgi:hypothetical protein
MRRKPMLARLKIAIISAGLMLATQAAAQVIWVNGNGEPRM